MNRRALGPLSARINRLRFFLGFAAIAMGLGFMRYWSASRYVYFPAFPGVLDTVVMVAIGAFLLAEIVLEAKKA